MEENCPNQITQVEQRTRNMYMYCVMICVNKDCKEKCDRERMPTPKERDEFNG